jgi:hypothetical protein
MHSRGLRKYHTSVEIAPTTKHLEVVEVYAVRGFKASFDSIIHTFLFLLETN